MATLPKPLTQCSVALTEQDMTILSGTQCNTVWLPDCENFKDLTIVLFAQSLRTENVCKTKFRFEILHRSSN